MKNTAVIILTVVLVIVIAVSGVLLTCSAAKASDESERLSGIVNILTYEKSNLESELESEKIKNHELNQKIEMGVSEYLKQINELEGQVTLKNEDISKLEAELEKRKNEVGFDLSAYFKKFSELEKYVIEQTPVLRVMLTEEELEEAKKQAEEKDDNPDDVWEHRWESKEEHYKKAVQTLKEQNLSKWTLDDILTISESEARVPRIAIYYQDLINGYTYSYNADEVFDGASVMKAPYITAVLEALTDYENGEINIKDGDDYYNAENLSKVFDIDEKVILDHETMDKPGSGELKDKPDGTELTYEELFKLSLEKSDNIAFGIIKKKFSNRWYYDFARKNNAKSPMTYEMNLTAREAGEMFKSIYYFTLTNEKYGELVKNSLEKSSHTVLSKSVLGKNSIHKYGWDKNGYHDVAIVYGERPYVVAVFTDLDCGGRDTDAYIRGIFKQIDGIHNDLNK